MTIPLHVPAEPCTSCPYRRDTPPGIWHETEYAKLPQYDDGPQGQKSLVTAPFACHHAATARDVVCRGWLTVHSESIAVRLAAMQGSFTFDEVYAPVESPLYGSGAEAAAAGMSGINDPSPAAIKVIERLDARLDNKSRLRYKRQRRGQANDNERASERTNGAEGMSAVKEPANGRKQRKSRAHVPGEIQSRYLLLLGTSTANVAKITGLRVNVLDRINAAIAKHGPGPYTPDEAAAMLGVSYRFVYRLIEEGEIKASKEEGEYRIPRGAMLDHVKQQLSEEGEIRARYLLFAGAPPSLAAICGRMTAAAVKTMKMELDKSGCGPASQGPYTTDQAALVLGLGDRGVRAYCQQGRLGSRFGGSYLIPRDELLDFGRKERRRGSAGSKAGK